MPLVSVVIASYNRANYISEAIDSVLNQTFCDVEIIVIDDGSTDNTRDVVAKYGPDVRYFWQENAERAAARNRGLQLARGEFISFLDSDDVWLPDKLEQELAIFQRSDAGLVYSDAQLIDDQGTVLRDLRRPSFEGWVTPYILQENFIVFSAHLARADVIRAAGGFSEDEALSGSEDWELWVRLSTRTKFAHSRAITTKYRVHSANSMSNAVATERSMDRALTIMESGGYLEPGQHRLLRRARAMANLINGINYSANRQRARACTCLLKSVKLSPTIMFHSRFAYVCLRTLLTPEMSMRLRQLKQRLSAHQV